MTARVLSEAELARAQESANAEAMAITFVRRARQLLNAEAMALTFARRARQLLDGHDPDITGAWVCIENAAHWRAKAHALKTGRR